MPDARPHVVIVGGGFGGLRAARGLRRAAVRVTLVDQRNHHLFQPLLYEVATAALSPADIAAPIRKVLSRQANASVLLGRVTGVDVERRIVKLADGEIGYDWLILASGATHSYFGHGEWAPFAPGLKSVDDALEIRRRFLLAFEAAERESDPASRRAKLTFVVVGGGPTGVEMAGTMSELARRSIPHDFRSIDTTTARVILVEANERLLPAYPPRLSDRAARDLRKLGVEVRLKSLVTAIDEGGVVIGSAGSERIDAENVIWAAGVEASAIGATLGVPLDHHGRVIVQDDLSIPGHREVFVIGDLAKSVDSKTSVEVPGVAQGALQMGAFAARIIMKECALFPPPYQVAPGDSTRRGGGEGVGRAPEQLASSKHPHPNPLLATASLRPQGEGGAPRPAFHYNDKGMMATIGRAKAVANIKGVHFAGPLAWLLWAVIHIVALIGFRNRLIVMLNWAWAYIIFQRGARLITGPSDLHLHGAPPGAR